MRQQYNDAGYILSRSLINPASLQPIKTILEDFHEVWLEDNKAFYLEKGLNSASITHSQYLQRAERLALFRFISQAGLRELILNAIPDKPCFMNTQLFFNPYNKTQKNYWHRDPQYHLSIAEQKLALAGPEVLHLRIALEDEPGLEIVPGTHKRWDKEEELNTRYEKDGRRVFDHLKGGIEIPLAAGDVLLFSANMIHRGLYDHNIKRLAFDILVCDADPELLKFVESDVLPDETLMKEIESPLLFRNTLENKIFLE